MSSYKIYTTEHDREVSAGDLLREKLLARGDEMDLRHWIERTEHTLTRISENAPGKEIGQGAPVTILIEMGGSMRGVRIQSAVAAARRLGDDLEASGRPFSILGNTTSQWKGGWSRQNWLDSGRPDSPGRLNDLLHVVFKGFDEDWHDTRPDICLALVDGILKENIDGEALHWAAGRQEEVGRPGQIIHIRDGISQDDSTVVVNPAGFLEDHVLETIEAIRDTGVAYRALNPDDAMPRYHPITFRTVEASCATLIEMMHDAIREMDLAPSPEDKPRGETSPY